MTGSHSRLGVSDRESRTTGVIRAYDTGTIGAAQSENCTGSITPARSSRSSSWSTLVLNVWYSYGLVEAGLCCIIHMDFSGHILYQP